MGQTVNSVDGVIIRFRAPREQLDVFITQDLNAAKRDVKPALARDAILAGYCSGNIREM
jgi:hypothetical protein